MIDLKHQYKCIDKLIKQINLCVSNVENASNEITADVN
jgi:hypothetical protein